MTLRHIEIFLAVCEAGCNTTRAAEALHLAQPAVSLAIRDLEEHYGTKFFDRLGKRLSITEAGVRFRQYAVHLSALFREMETELQGWDAGGVLRIGASVTIGSQFLPEYVRRFQTLRPGAEVRAVVAPSDELEEKILQNSLDAALIEGIPHSPLLVSEAYMDDSLAVVCPNDGRFTSGQVLTQAEFRSQPFLLREPGSGTREVFQRAAESAGFSVAPIWEAMSTTALVNAVICGLGISVLPARMLKGPLSRGLVVTVQVEGLSFQRKFHIIRHRDKHLTETLRAFLALCRSTPAEDILPEYTGLY